MSRRRDLNDRLTLLEERIERLPSWLQPALAGAFMLFVMVGGRMLFALPVLLFFMIRDGFSALFLTVGVLLGAMAAGAIGGLAYSAIGRHLLRFGRLGAYAAGTVCVGAYLLPLLFAFDKVEGRNRMDLSDPATWIIAGVASVVFGTVLGHTLFLPEPQRPKRQWIQRKQRVTSRRPQN